jgi:diketogulonate reductase-like aldo/keto reductase
MPIFGLGTYLSKGNDCQDSVGYALKHGYIHLDTAQVYNNEEQVGKGLADSKVERSKVFVTTKLWLANYPEELAVPSLESSLKKLRLDYVDLVLLHAPGMPSQSKKDSAEEGNKALRKSAWLALEAFHSAGKTKAIGVSNFWPQHIDEILSYCKIRPHVNQIEYHPWNQRPVQVEYCQKQGIVVEGWGPFAKNQILDDKTLKAIADKHGKSVAQVCVRWCLQKGIVCIPKSVKESRIVENSQVFDFELSADQMKEIDAMHKGYLSAKTWEHDEVP